MNSRATAVLVKRVEILVVIAVAIMPTSGFALAGDEFWSRDFYRVGVSGQVNSLLSYNQTLIFGGNIGVVWPFLNMENQGPEVMSCVGTGQISAAARCHRARTSSGSLADRHHRGMASPSHIPTTALSPSLNTEWRSPLTVGMISFAFKKPLTRKENDPQEPSTHLRRRNPLKCAPRAPSGSRRRSREPGAEPQLQPFPEADFQGCGNDGNWLCPPGEPNEAMGH